MLVGCVTSRSVIGWRLLPSHSVHIKMGAVATPSRPRWRRPRQPLCFRCNYPRRPALCIISVKPKRSEATWRLVFLHVSSCDDGSASGTADSQRTEIIAFHAPRFSRAHLAGGVVTWSTRDNVWLSLSRRVTSLWRTWPCACRAARLSSQTMRWRKSFWRPWRDRITFLSTSS